MQQRRFWGRVIIALLLMGLAVMPAVAAGKSEAPASGMSAAVTPAGTLPIVKSPVTMSAFIVQSTWIEDLKTNAATAELEKRTGIHLDLVIASGDPSAITEKRNLLLASGDYPEIFLSGQFNNEDILQYGVQQKILQPINSLIDKYGTNVKDVFKYYPDMQANLTAPDGNIYGLPQINECFHCTYAQKMWINSGWIQKLGLKMPTTPDELYNVLKAFKTRDPNGNGKADEIPLAGSINSWHNPVQDFIMNAFVYDDGGPDQGGSWFAVGNNHTLSFSPAQSGWRDGLRYLHKLYADGLIYPASFTQSLDQAAQIGNNPDTEILGATTAGHLGMVLRIENNPPFDRHKHWEALAPLKGPNGVQFAGIYRGISGATFAITNKAKNPEAAFRLADYIYSPEGTMLLEFGPQGTRWKPAGPTDKGLEGQPAKWTEIATFKGDAGTWNTDWGQAVNTVRTAEWRSAWTADQNLLTVDGYELRLYRETKEKYAPYGPKEWFTPVFLNPSQTEQAAQLKTNIKDFVTQSTVQFIVGQKDVEKDWDSYLAQLKSLGLDTYMKIYQDAYSAKFAGK